VRIFHKTDEVWQRVMKHLGYPIPAFTLSRRVAFWKEGDQVKALGLAADGTPASWIKGVAVVNGPTVVSRHDPEPTPLQNYLLPPTATQQQLVLFSMGHYNECPVALNMALFQSKLPVVLCLTYSPADGSWAQMAESEADKKIQALLAMVSTGVVPGASTATSKVNNNNNNNNNNAANTGGKHVHPDLEAGGGFAVYPKHDCPHVANLFLDEIAVDCDLPCSECGDTSENWTCLTCNKVGCSRYVKGHMAAHVSNKGDRCYAGIVASFSDFSIWCNACDSYITHPSLAYVKKALELSKFGGSQ